MIDPPDREIAVFSEVRRLSPDQRAAYLDEACAGDSGLRQRVEELLEASEEAGEFLQGPASGVERPAQPPASGNPSAVTGAPATFAEKAGDRIGRYKLLQQIGEGGCGVVYMAEQEEPVRRLVALKVIKLGMDTKSVIARFEAERQALALMDHPNIAKILDVGATETGRPYFVMELVRGIKITDYCDQNEVPTRQRLELFVQVCQGIQHAHQKGVIHRDIKPSNILVTLRDGVPVPKVIDFGIAKATQQRLTDKTLFTAFQQFIGTPAYMSPEQAEMSELGIDTRSDIYSLGILLYELLTGTTPFDSKALLKAGLDEIRRIIRELEPLPPSTRLNTMTAADLITVAKKRQAEPARLGSLLQGDLDWIVMRALDKDRTRRYATANGLAADVQRHLADEPIVARPPNKLYRFQKMVRRNKLAVGAAAAVLAALLIGLGVSTVLFVQEREARRISHVEAAKSEQAYTFLQNMLAGVGPEVARGRDVTMVRNLLDDTEQRIDKELRGQPEAQALLSSTIAGIYDQLGEYHKAAAMTRKALRLERAAPGKNEAAVITLLDHLGLVLFHGGDLQAAADALREALDRLKKLPEPHEIPMARSLNNLALVLWKWSDLIGAEGAFQEALVRLKKTPVDKDSKMAMASVLANLGLVQWERGDLAGAEASERLGLVLRLEIDGAAGSPDAQSLLNNLSLVLRDKGDLPGAEAAERKALAALNTMLGPNHPNTVWVRNNLALILRRQGALSGDTALFREALRLNPDDALTSDALSCSLAIPSLLQLVPGPQALAKPWRYTFSQPGLNWLAADFVDDTWQTAPAPLGFPGWLHRSENTGVAHTNLWLRQEFELMELPTGPLAFRINRNQDAQVFLNGVEATPEVDWNDAEVLVACSVAGRAALKPGRNVLAVRCQEADGGTPIDVRICMTPDLTLGRRLLVEEFNHAITADPERAELYSGRASAFAQMGKWSEAGTDLAKAIELKPLSNESWYKLAPLLLEQGDLPGYDRARQAALKRFARPDGPNGDERVARPSLLVPANPEELAAAVKLADAAAAASYADANLASRQFTKGLADYRQGLFSTAIEWTSKALVTGAQRDLPGWTNERERNRAAAAYEVEAMARYHLNQKAEARDSLSKAREIVRTQFPSPDGGDLGRDWPDWMIAHLLLREATALVEGK